MMRWKETFKTVILNLLILTSFILTSMLWSNQPQLQFIEPVQYVESKPVQTRQLKELVTPEAIIFHYGDDLHTRASASYAHYRYITQEMEKWYFNDLRYYPLDDDKWEALTTRYRGLEILFRGQVPMPVITQLYMINGDTYDQQAEIDRIWLYLEEEENVVYALFISSERKMVLRARTVVSPKDLLESYLPPGRPLPEQFLKVTRLLSESESDRLKRPFWQIFYLPKEQLTMQKFLYNYLPVTEDELMEAYFLDRTLVRRIVERDRTVIFTDGSRSIQMQPDRQVITFTDPAFHQGTTQLNPEEKVREAITFINKHLGWTDDYHFEKIEEDEAQGDTISFRQYIGAYPLVNGDAYPLDTITVTSEYGQVATVNRSLIDLDKYIDNEEWTVMSGPELFGYLREHEQLDTNLVTHAYLAYQTLVHQGYVELTPVWVVEMQDGQQYVVQAQSLPEEGGEAHGLE